MKLKCFIFLLVLVFITGCENKEEVLKNEYIAMKNEVFNNKNYNNREIPVDIITTIDRVNDEELCYKVVIKNPRENMHNIKVMVVHNYYNEDVFPSIGVFDDTKSLLLNSLQEVELVLEDNIQTTKDIDKLDLEFKIWIEYIDDNGEKKDIYYKTT